MFTFIGWNAHCLMSHVNTRRDQCASGMPLSQTTTYPPAPHPPVIWPQKEQESCAFTPSSLHLHADEGIRVIRGSQNAAVLQISKASLGIKILLIGNEGRKILRPISPMFLIPLHMLRRHACERSSARLIFPACRRAAAWGTFFGSPKAKRKKTKQNVCA